MEDKETEKTNDAVVEKENITCLAVYWYQAEQVWGNLTYLTLCCRCGKQYKLCSPSETPHFFVINHSVTSGEESIIYVLSL